MWTGIKTVAAMPGLTSGYSKSGNKYYKTNRPKAVYLYPLMRKARELLTASFIPYDFNFRKKEGNNGNAYSTGRIIDVYS